VFRRWKVGNLAYLFAAYAIIWLLVLIYSYSISARQRSVQREIELLKAVLAERDSAKPQM